SAKDARTRVDQEEHEQDERAALAEVQSRAEELNLILPPGFVSFARDFPRRSAVWAGNSYFEVNLHDAVVEEFPQIADGYLISFFADMNYGNPHQCVWSLYLIPEIAWHCVVVFELPDDTGERLPEDLELISYCAPSFQAFLYRWWLETRRKSG